MLRSFLSDNINITFHDIHSQDWLRNTLKAVGSLYRFVHIRELEDFYHSGKTLKNTCHITFDDGHRTFYENSFPVLKEFQVPASIYVSPLIIRERKNFWFQDIAKLDAGSFKKELAPILDLNVQQLEKFSLSSILKSLPIDKIQEVIDLHLSRHGLKRTAPQNMTTAQLLEVHRSGLVSIGAHTMNHPILKNETAERARYEIEASVNELSDLLGEKTRYFAYPNGMPGLDYSRREVKILDDCGIQLSFTMEKKSYEKTDHRLTIPRYSFETGGPNRVKMKLLLGKSWRKLKNKLTSPEDIKQRIQMKEIVQESSPA